MTQDNFTLRLGEQTRARLEALATRERRTVAWLVRDAIEGYLKEREEAHGLG